MNHYEILEVSANASQEVIRAAYRSLMQRYHPDRNPGNTETAERALLVNQAYEVLSDASKRAAYDIELGHQLTGHSNSIGDKRRHVPTPASAANGSQSSWLTWLIGALIVLSGWFILAPSGIRQSPESGLSKTRQSLKADPSAERQDIPVLIEKLTVNLKGPDTSSGDAGKLPEDAEHVLFIPVLGVRVGTFDPERAIGYIERNKEVIGQKLAEKLASAKYEELNKNDGEDYLKDIILDSIGETTGADRHEDFPPSPTEKPGRYGAIDVLLPKSFSVR